MTLNKPKIFRDIDTINASLGEKANQSTVTTLQNQVNGISASPKGVYATVPLLISAKPTGDTGIYVVTGNVAEISSLAISAIPTVAGNVTVTLNGVAVNVAVDPATDTTTALVATKIRNATYAGWTTGGTGSTVTFTCNTTGVKTDSVYSAGSTGATGTMSTTTQGVDNDGKWYYWNGSAWTSGGTYQAIQLDDTNKALINVTDMTQYLFRSATNLVNTKNYIAGAGYHATSGVINTGYSNYSYDTNYYEIGLNTKLCFNGNDAMMIAMYDENKNYLRTIYQGFTQDNGYYYYTFSSDEKYFRISMQTVKLSTRVISFSSIGVTSLVEDSTKRYFEYSVLGQQFYLDLMAYLKINYRNTPGNVIIVAQSGGDYTSIDTALTASSDGDTIIVFPGIYIETIIVQKNVTIQGIDKTRCILKYSLGDYSCPPLNLGNSAIIRNMTIISEQPESNPPSNPAYCIHIDSVTTIGCEILIENCNLVSYSNACLGIGLRDGLTITIRDTQIKNKRTSYSNTQYGSGLFFHNSIAEASNQNLIIDNCNIESDGDIAFKCQDASSNASPMYAHFYRNMLYSKTTGKSCLDSSTILNGNVLIGTQIYLADDSFGNNISRFNI